MRWIALVGGVLAMAAPVQADVPAPFFAEHERTFTAHKQPRDWVFPGNPGEVAYVFDINGARFIDGDENERGVSFAHRRGVTIRLRFGHRFQLRYRAARPTAFTVYWAEL